MLAPGTILIDRYRIESLLGQGGMGAVYRAYDILAKSPRAIKEFLFQSLPIDDGTLSRVTRDEAKKQFLSEAQLLFTLDHSNLPKVDNYFLENNNLYLAMALIEGEDLALKLERHNGPLPVQQVLHWIGQVLNALVYCHKKGVIHRDIKPGNIIVTAEEKAYLVDFGIAHLIDETRRPVSARSVTSGFSSPEQYTSETNERSDIYSLGATMYMLLSGEAPQDALQREGNDQVRSKLEQAPDITSPLAELVMKALALDPSERYQTAEKMRNALLDMTPPWQWTQESGPIHTTRTTGMTFARRIPHTWRKGKYDLECDVAGTNRPVLIALDGDRRIFIARESGEIDMYEEHFGTLVRRAVFVLNPLLSGVQVQVLDIATDSTGCIVLASIGSENKRVLYSVGGEPSLLKVEGEQALAHNPFRMACLDGKRHFVTESKEYICYRSPQDRTSAKVNECAEVTGIAASKNDLFVAGKQVESTESAPIYALWKRPIEDREESWQRLSGINSTRPIRLAPDPKYGYRHIFALWSSGGDPVITRLRAGSGDILRNVNLKGLFNIEGIVAGLDRVYVLCATGVRWYGRQRLFVKP